MFPCQWAAANELGDRCLRQRQPLCPAWVEVCSLPGLEPGLLFQHMGTAEPSTSREPPLATGSSAGQLPRRSAILGGGFVCCYRSGAGWLAGHEVQSISVAPWSCHPSHGAISSGPGGALQLAAGAPAQRPACCCELTFGKAGNKPPSSAAGPSAPAFGCLSSSRRQTLLCCSCLLQICGLGPPKACQESRASGGSACQGRTGAEERPSRCCGRWRSPSACRALLPSHPLI